MLFYAKLNAVAHSFLHKFQLFNNTGKLEAKTTVAQCDLEPISNNSRFAHAVLQKFYVKQQIEVPWILLTTQTNLGKFTVVLPFPTEALGHTVRIFIRLLFSSRFSQKMLISRNSQLRTLFCTKIANLKMSKMANLKMSSYF